MTISAKNQTYFLNLFDRIFPVSWLGTIKDARQGYELFEAFAAAGARLSTAAQNMQDDAFIITAEGGSFSTGQISLSRSVPLGSEPAVVVKAGSLVSTISGSSFFTLEDVTFGVGNGGPHIVNIQATVQGYQWNIAGPSTSADGTTLEGPINLWENQILDPPFQADTPEIIVTQVGATSGGKPPMLDVLGEQRGLPRRALETDNTYRVRIRQLLDTVSPDAIINFCNGIFDPLGQTYTFIEVHEESYVTCYDGPTASIGDYESNLFAYDDTREQGGTPAPPGNGVFYGRYLDDIEYRGAFIIVVPNLPAMQDVSIAYDDVDSDKNVNHITSIGRRAHNAYDVPSNATSVILQGGYDGFDLKKQAVYAGFFATLQKIKAGGVAAIVELEGQ